MSDQFNRFDPSFYEQGVEACATGASLLDVFKAFASHDMTDRKAEDRVLSYVLGFGDELLSELREAAKPRSVDLTLNINVTGSLDDGAKLSLIQAIEDAVANAVKPEPK
ncbi:hypothetical protein DNX69_10840 [Rhodopseudomonas palustris]|uniref:Uncharacterized protein n=1 Tax=Rhodopseudomonas palustris TaxID=1076 RepID=A0A323UHJ0_RHOPL|nr:hypothetical protein [Rhodopseudomonas palustris]PZA12462.1 hypothetical protein DNX69_10840 [Rhodopseudomonas palustris]